MAPVRVFLGGEGPNELGGWFNEPEYRGERPACGVLEALLRRVRADGWEVVGGIRWSKIRKFRAGRHADEEQRNVKGLALMAKEQGADVVAFSRDSDGDRARVRSIEDSVAGMATDFPDGPRVAGGAAVPTVEAWIAALAGRAGAEAMSRPALLQLLESELGKGAKKDTPQYCEVVERAELAKLPADATSLRTWIERARAAMQVG